MANIESHIRQLQGADFESEPEPKLSGLWLVALGAAGSIAFLALGYCAYWALEALAL